jgi:hypothetical protein
MRSLRGLSFLHTVRGRRARRVQSLHGQEDPSVDDELREERSDHREQTRAHEQIVAELLDELGLEEDEEVF